MDGVELGGVVRGVDGGGIKGGIAGIRGIRWIRGDKGASHFGASHPP